MPHFHKRIGIVTFSLSKKCFCFTVRWRYNLVSMLKMATHNLAMMKYQTAKGKGWSAQRMWQQSQSRLFFFSMWITHLCFEHNYVFQNLPISPVNLSTIWQPSSVVIYCSYHLQTLPFPELFCHLCVIGTCKCHQNVTSSSEMTSCHGAYGD